jgi:hypothetical protein
LSKRKKKAALSPALCRQVIREYSKDLEVYDIDEWKRACKSFAPIKYSDFTRKSWLKKNAYRLPSAREIVDFMDAWTCNLRLRKRFDKYTVSAIRDCLIRGIRAVMMKKSDEKGILNIVKLAGFRTLIKWADNRTELEIGPYNGAEKIPSSSQS